jgi:AAA15 family ATPase/GTPase
MDVAIIENKIFEIRGQKVMLDFDLAQLYEVETRVLNQAVKRNAIRFPEDFMFRLTTAEWDSMKSQIVTTSKKQVLISQIVISKTETSGGTQNCLLHLPNTALLCWQVCYAANLPIK